MVMLSDAVERLAVAATVVVASMSLQGCDFIPAVHEAGAWEDKPNYFTEYQFTPVMGSSAQMDPNSPSVLSSCSVSGLPSRQQCSGNGACVAWGKPSTEITPLYFCKCKRDWADPECRTRRKSQVTAYLLSLFGGCLGLDRFYLGEYFAGLAKLSTVGGFGFWWVADLVRIGSGPVYAGRFRLAADLNHGIYMASVLVSFVTLGYLFFGVYGAYALRQERRQGMLQKAEEEFFKEKERTVDVDWSKPMGGGPATMPQIILKPVGLGDYTITGKTNIVKGWPEVAGGPYRNARFYDSIVNMREDQGGTPPQQYAPDPRDAYRTVVP